MNCEICGQKIDERSMVSVSNDSLCETVFICQNCDHEYDRDEINEYCFEG